MARASSSGPATGASVTSELSGSIRSRYGFGRRPSHSPRSTRVLPDLGTERVDLVALLENALGDHTALRSLLRTKMTASRFDYKGRIQELLDFTEDLKSALSGQMASMLEVIDTVAPLQEDINTRLSVAAVELTVQRSASQQFNSEMASARSKVEAHDAEVAQLRLELLASHQERQRIFNECSRTVELCQGTCKREVAELADSHQRQLDEALRTHQRRLEELERQESECRDMLAKAASREQHLEAHAASLEGDREEVKQAHSALAQEHATLTGSVAELRAAKRDLQAQLEEREQLLTEREAQRNALQEEHRESQGKLQSSEAELEKLRAQLCEQDGLLEERRSVEEALRARLREAQEKSSSDQASLEELRGKLSGAEASIEQSSSELEVLRTRLVEAEELRTQLQRQLEELQAQLAESDGLHSQRTEVLLQKESELEALRGQVQEREQLEISTRSELVQRESEVQALHIRCSESNGLIDELQRQLEGQTAAIKEMRAENQFHQAQLLQKEDIIRQRDADLRAAQAQVQAKEELLRRRDEDWRESLQSLREIHADHSSQLQQERQHQQELEREVQNLRPREAELREEARRLELALQQLRAEADAREEAEAEAQRALQRAEAERDELAEIAAKSQASSRGCQEKLVELASALEKARQEVGAAQETLNAKCQEAERLGREKNLVQLEFSSYKEHHGVGNSEQMCAISELKVTVDRLSSQVEAKHAELRKHQGSAGLQKEYAESLEQRLASAERARRELHNHVQELKGSIRVFCRVRPSPPGVERAIEVHEPDKVSISNAGESYPFSFDRVFGEAAPQEDIFEEVSALVQSALDGYRVCIFAYGQTGSGKTYTMQGPPGSVSHWGLIPRSLTKIFEVSQAMATQGWVWTMKASFFEVYNECFRDLLVEGSTNSGCGNSPPVHVVKHDEAWGTMVTNMNSVEVKSMPQIHELTAKATRRRSVGATDMNAASSRSHCVFALYLTGVNRKLNTELHGALHLVDLAGSERLDKSGSSGDRLKEAQNINKSLSSLADVFLAKTERRSHVPFRNSKLTHLMEPCLSGQGKALMLVNVCSDGANSHESLCSMRFASQVNQCNTGGRARRSAKSLTEDGGPAKAAAPTKVHSVVRMQSARSLRNPA